MSLISPSAPDLSVSAVFPLFPRFQPIPCKAFLLCAKVRCNILDTSHDRFVATLPGHWSMRRPIKWHKQVSRSRRDVDMANTRRIVCPVYSLPQPAGSRRSLSPLRKTSTNLFPRLPLSHKGCPRIAKRPSVLGGQGPELT